MDFKSPQVVYILEKYDELSKLVAFAQNWGILQTRMNQKGERPHENEFWLFLNTKINVTKS